MAKPITGASSKVSGENPAVHSKASHHGIPRSHGRVSTIGGTAPQTWKSGSSAKKGGYGK